MGQPIRDPADRIDLPVPDDILAEIARESYERGGWPEVARQMREIVMAEAELSLAMRYLANADNGVCH